MNYREKPKLSFLALHYHMHGRDLFSQSALEAPGPGRGVGIRHNPEALCDTLGSPLRASASGGHFAGTAARASFVTRASSSPHSDIGNFERSAGIGLVHTANSQTCPDQPIPLGRWKSDNEVRLDSVTPKPRPSMPRSISAPSKAPSPLLLSPHPPSLSGASSSGPSKKYLKKLFSRPPLGVAAFSDAFVGVISSSDNLFPCHKAELPRERRVKATAHWVKQEKKTKRE